MIFGGRTPKPESLPLTSMCANFRDFGFPSFPAFDVGTKLSVPDLVSSFFSSKAAICPDSRKFASPICPNRPPLPSDGEFAFPPARKSDRTRRPDHQPPRSPYPSKASLILRLTPPRDERNRESGVMLNVCDFRAPNGILRFWYFRRKFRRRRHFVLTGLCLGIRVLRIGRRTTPLFTMTAMTAAATTNATTATAVEPRNRPPLGFMEHLGC